MDDAKIMNPGILMMVFGLVALGVVFISIGAYLILAPRERIEMIMLVQHIPSTYEQMTAPMPIVLCIGVFLLMCAGYIVWQ